MFVVIQSPAIHLPRRRPRRSFAFRLSLFAFAFFLLCPLSFLPFLLPALLPIQALSLSSFLPPAYPATFFPFPPSQHTTPHHIPPILELERLHSLSENPRLQCASVAFIFTPPTPASTPTSTHKHKHRQSPSPSPPPSLSL